MTGLKKEDVIESLKSQLEHVEEDVETCPLSREYATDRLKALLTEICGLDEYNIS